jgi:peptidase E
MAINMSKPIYLMAGRGGNNAAIIRSVLKESGRPRPSVAYVGVASGDDWGFYLMVSRTIKAAGDCTVKRVVLASSKADLNKARETLESADVIFMSGGDVEEGMQVLQKKDLGGFLVDLFRQGKVFFGMSAGSIMLAREWVRWPDPEDDSGAELFPCLGMAPVLCDTHAEEDKWEELKAALRLSPEGTRGFGIATRTCLKVYPDGREEALGGPVAVYVRRGGQAKKLDDLTPQ